jgi:predicted nucleic acid-binding protein
MFLLDSSAWIEIFTGGPSAETFLEAAGDHPDLVVPTIVIYEVVRWARRRETTTRINEVAALLTSARVVPLSEAIALEASGIAQFSRLAMADSIILATSRLTGAEIWTQDADFKGFPDVRYIPRAQDPS